MAQHLLTDIGLTKPEQARYAAHLLLTYIFTCASSLGPLRQASLVGH